MTEDERIERLAEQVQRIHEEEGGLTGDRAARRIAEIASDDDLLKVAAYMERMANPRRN